MGGNLPLESVATFVWNGWQPSTGISGNLRLEYASNRDIHILTAEVALKNGTN